MHWRENGVQSHFGQRQKKVVKQESKREKKGNGTWKYWWWQKSFLFHKSAIIMCTHFFTWQRKIYHSTEKKREQKENMIRDRSTASRATVQWSSCCWEKWELFNLIWFQSTTILKQLSVAAACTRLNTIWLFYAKILVSVSLHIVLPWLNYEKYI